MQLGNFARKIYSDSLQANADLDFRSSKVVAKVIGIAGKIKMLRELYLLVHLLAIRNTLGSDHFLMKK